MPPRSYLDELTGALAAALGASLRAVLLTGSAAVGAWRAETSDVDVLVVVEGATRAQLERVVETCSHDALPCPARKLELVVYERCALTAASDRPHWSLNLNTGRDEQHVGWDPDAEPAFWFVIDLAFAVRHAVPLVGPPPGELIPAPPSEEAVDDAFDAMVEWYERHEPEAAATARARAAEWHRARTFTPKPGLPST